MVEMKLLRMIVCACVCVHVCVCVVGVGRKERERNWTISVINAALPSITMTPNFQFIFNWSFTLVSHTQTINPATSTLTILAGLGCYNELPYSGWLKQQLFISYSCGD